MARLSLDTLTMRLAPAGPVIALILSNLYATGAAAQVVTLPVIVENCMRNAAMPGITVGAKNGGSGISEIHGHASIPLPRGMKAGDPITLAVYDPPDVALLFPLRGEGARVPSGIGDYVEIDVIRTRDLRILSNAACLAGLVALAPREATPPRHSQSEGTAPLRLAAFAPEAQSQAPSLGLIDPGVADRLGFSVPLIEAAMAQFSSDPLTWKAILLTAQIDFGNFDPFSTVFSFSIFSDVEFGIGWWGLSRGTLQTLLANMRSADPAQFDAAMGGGLPFIQTLMKAPGPVAMEMATKELIDPDNANQIKVSWKSRFGQLGSNPTFQRVQFQALQPLIDKARAATTHLGLRSERGFAFVYDVLYSSGSIVAEPRIKATFDGFRQEFGRDPDEAEKLLMLAHLVALRPSFVHRPQMILRAYALATGHGKLYGRTIDLESVGLGMRDMRSGEAIALQADKAVTNKLLQGWLPADAVASPPGATPATAPSSAPQPLG